MINKRFFGISLLFILSIVLLSSCAKPPEQEMQAAREAVENAASAEADLYASDLYNMVQDSLSQAETFIAEKKYADARRLALFAKSFADSAAAMAGINKEQMKTSAESIIADASTKLEALKKAKIPSSMRTKINNEIKVFEETLLGAKNDFEAGNYKDAFDKASDVVSRVEEAKKEIVKGTGVVGS